jgi:four helix bundle protein
VPGASRQLYFRQGPYRLALETARWAAAQAIPPQRKHLRDQLVRAADSIVLAVAEGSGLSGDARRHHYRIALGSVCEVAAVVDLLAPRDHGEVRERIVRVAATLLKSWPLGPRRRCSSTSSSSDASPTTPWRYSGHAHCAPMPTA